MTDAGVALIGSDRGATLRRPWTPGYRRATALALWLLILGNGAASVWLWVDAGGLSSTSSTGDVLNSIGRVTGMTDAYLALVQVLLFARLP